MNFHQWYLSLGFSTGYRWTTPAGFLSLGGGVRMGLIQNSYDNNIYRPFDPALRERNNEWTPKNSIWSTLSLDRRDLYYDPSSGYLLYERYGIYGIFEEEREHYQRSDSKAEYFLTLFDLPVSEKWYFKAVFGLHTALSLIFKQPGRGDPASPTPTVEDANKLAVDGMFVGRGWSGEYGVKGLLMWDNWAELRIPLVQGILAWDFFFDAAGVETKQGYYFGKYKDDEGNRLSNFTIDNMRFGFGGGLRFTMPQFPFRLSLVKRFRTVDGGVFQWERGIIFANDNPGSGIDPVLSFAISY
jgi:outer membrane protein insertion porin family